MPTTRVDFPTPYDHLQGVKNNYSSARWQFEQRGCAFVDLGEEDSDEDREEKKKLRDALRQQFLQLDGDVPALAVIVNVAGRPKAFPDVLQSLAHQSFVEKRPNRVEVVLVQDGSDGVLDEPDLHNVLEAMAEFPSDVRLQALRLAGDRESRGRGTARNVGIFCADPETDVIMFLDDAMILDRHFVAEQMLRHKYVTHPIALLGFKANRKFGNFDEYKSQRDTMKFNRPNFREDLKWTHKLTADEATIEEGDPGFYYGGKHYEIDSIISYMKITDNFNALLGDKPIGHRALPMFFHTGLTSVTYDLVRAVGGFETAFDVGLWGFEDSYLGLLLAVKGVKLVPCPSSVAYKVEIKNEEVASNKILDIKILRHKFWELAKKREWNSYNEQKLKDQIDRLSRQGRLQPVPLDRPGHASSTRTDVPSVKPNDAKTHDGNDRPIGLLRYLSQRLLGVANGYVHSHKFLEWLKRSTLVVGKWVQPDAQDFPKPTADSGGIAPVPVPAPVEAPLGVRGLFRTSLPTIGRSEYEVLEKFTLFGGRPIDLSIGFTAIEYAVATQSFDRDLVATLCETIRAPDARRIRSFTISSLPGAGLSLALAQLVRDLSLGAHINLFWVIDEPDHTCRVLSRLSEDVADSFYSHISACSPRAEHAVIILDDMSKAPPHTIRNFIAFRERCKQLANERVGPRVTFIFGYFGDAPTCSEDFTFKLDLTINDRERCYQQMTSVEPRILLWTGGLGAILRAHPESRWYENDAQAFIDFLLQHGQPTNEANKHWLARTEGLDRTDLAIFTTTAVAQLIGLPIEEAVVKRLFSSTAPEPLQDVEQIVRKARGLAVIQQDWKGLGLSCARRARSILERTNTFRFDFLCETFSKFVRESLEHFQADGHGAYRTLEFARHIFQRLSKHPLYRFKDDQRIAHYLFSIHLDALIAASGRWNVVEKARWAGTLSRVVARVRDAEPMDDTSFSKAVCLICGLCEDTFSEVSSHATPPSPAVALSLYRASRILLSLPPTPHTNRIRNFCVSLLYGISTEEFFNILDQVLVSDVNDPSYRANELLHARSKFEDSYQGKKDRNYCRHMSDWYMQVEQFFNRNRIEFDAGSWLTRGDYVWIDRRASATYREPAVAALVHCLKQACYCVQHYPYSQGTWGEAVAKAVTGFLRENPTFDSEFPNWAVRAI